MDRRDTGPELGRRGNQRLIFLTLMVIPSFLLSYRNIKLSSFAFLDVRYDDSPVMTIRNESSEPSLLLVNSSFHSLIPIERLVKYNYTCPKGLFPIENTYLPLSKTHPPNRKIPKVIHITSKSRCATGPVIKNIDKWRFKNYSIYFHDDDAVQELFQHPYTRNQFPTLRETLKCVTSGATKSDLWRYLVLYMYGGIYTDIDNSPQKFNGETITDSDDSFFVMESLGIISQYFIASSPGHPLMRHMLETGIENLKGILNVMVNNPAQKTGPGAAKVGFVNFLKEAGIETSGYIDAGIFYGLNNRSITVIGTKNRHKEYVNRGGLSHSDKVAYYKAIGGRHFTGDWKADRAKGKRVSCLEHLIRTNGTDKVANYYRGIEITNETRKIQKVIYRKNSSGKFVKHFETKYLNP